MKKTIVFIVVAMLILTSGLIASADSIVRIFIDGDELKSDVPVELEDGKTTASVRDMAEALGASVSWDPKTNSVIINSNKDTSQDLRISRLQQALIPQDHLSAATVWAEGVKMRNGALQYALLSPNLQNEKYQEFADMGWSTGTSSPWIKEYTVTEKGNPQDGIYIYQIEYVYTDSTQSIWKSYENITVEKFDMGWMISSIDPISVAGEITELEAKDDGTLKGIFVEGEENGIGIYDMANVLIGEETTIYDGYSSKTLKPSDLKKGDKVEVTFIDGPMLMIYPPSVLGKVIRVLE